MQKNTEVATRIQDAVGIIEITGEVTSFSEKILDETYDELAGDKVKKVCLSFENVTYINSAGMAIIIGILTRSRNRKQKLCCWGLTEHYQKIFEMVGLTKYMPHFEDEQAALA